MSKQNKPVTKIIIKNVRCSYVYVDYMNKKGGYGVQPILEPDHPQMKEIRRCIKNAAVAKFGSDVKMGRLKTPLRDADKEEFDDKHLKGKIFFNANNDKKPGVVNRFNKKASEDEIQELCFSGAFFHVSVNFYGFDNDEQKGVAAGLNNVMLRKEGDRLDGSTSASEDFEGCADNSDDADDFDDDDDWDE